MKTLKEYVFYKAADILLHLERKMNMLRLARESDVTIGHVMKTLREMEKVKMVTLTKDGRQIWVDITPKGEQVRQLVLKIKEMENES